MGDIPKLLASLPLQFSLEPHQTKGVSKLLSNFFAGRGLLLADDPGLGKTRQLLAALYILLLHGFLDAALSSSTSSSSSSSTRTPSRVYCHEHVHESKGLETRSIVVAKPISDTSPRLIDLLEAGDICGGGDSSINTSSVGDAKERCGADINDESRHIVVSVESDDASNSSSGGSIDERSDGDTSGRGSEDDDDDAESSRRRLSLVSMILAPQSVLESWRDEIERVIPTPHRVWFWTCRSSLATAKPPSGARVMLATYDAINYCAGRWAYSKARGLGWEVGKKVPRARKGQSVEPTLPWTHVRRLPAGSDACADWTTTDSRRERCWHKVPKRGGGGGGTYDVANVGHQQGWLLILDEATRIANGVKRGRNMPSQIATTLFTLPVRVAWCATGTPVMNNIVDMASYARLVTESFHPSHHADWWARFASGLSVTEKRKITTRLVKRGSGFGSSSSSGSSDDALDSWKKQYSLRRTKSLLGLPPLTIEEHALPFTHAQERIMLHYVDEAMDVLEEYRSAYGLEKNQCASRILALITCFRQICVSPWLVQQPGQIQGREEEDDDEEEKEEAEATPPLSPSASSTTSDRHSKRTRPHLDDDTGDTEKNGMADEYRLRKKSRTAAIVISDASSSEEEGEADLGSDADKSRSLEIKRGGSNDTSLPSSRSSSPRSLRSSRSSLVAPLPLSPSSSVRVWHSRTLDPGLWRNTSKASDWKPAWLSKNPMQLVADSPRLAVFIAHLAEATNQGESYAFFSQWTQALAEVYYVLTATCGHSNDTDCDDDGKEVSTMEATERVQTQMSAGLLVALQSQLARLRALFVRNPPLVLYGKLTPLRRKVVIDAFRIESHSQHSPLLLCSTKCGGVGLNLQTARKGALLDVAWSPATDRQAIDRMHRMGQTKPVHVLKLTSSGILAIDNYMVGLQHVKLEHSAQICDDVADSLASEDADADTDDLRVELGEKRSRRAIAEFSKYIEAVRKRYCVHRPGEDSHSRKSKEAGMSKSTTKRWHRQSHNNDSGSDSESNTSDDAKSGSGSDDGNSDNDNDDDADNDDKKDNEDVIGIASLHPRGRTADSAASMASLSHDKTQPSKRTAMAQQAVSVSSATRDRPQRAPWALTRAELRRKPPSAFVKPLPVKKTSVRGTTTRPPRPSATIQTPKTSISVGTISKSNKMTPKSASLSLPSSLAKSTVSVSSSSFGTPSKLTSIRHEWPCATCGFCNSMTTLTCVICSFPRL